MHNDLSQRAGNVVLAHATSEFLAQLCCDISAPA
jgi:hypothetical protein